MFHKLAGSDTSYLQDEKTLRRMVVGFAVKVV
jgi:hypothetical protein